MKYFSIPNLMLYVVSGQLFVYLVDVLGFVEPSLEYWISFSRSLIMKGQVWRAITFLFQPGGGDIISFLIGLYFSVFIARSLEGAWGSASFTRYYLLGVIGTIIGGFITGGASITYLSFSLFIAFAILYPNTELLLFFFLPVKAKYMGYAMGAIYLLSLISMIVSGNISGVVSLLVSLINLIIFFGPTLYRDLRHRYRHREIRRQFRDNDRYW